MLLSKDRVTMKTFQERLLAMQFHNNWRNHIAFGENQFHHVTWLNTFHHGTTPFWWCRTMLLWKGNAKLFLWTFPFKASVPPLSACSCFNRVKSRNSRRCFALRFSSLRRQFLWNSVRIVFIVSLLLSYLSLGFCLFRDSK